MGGTLSATTGGMYDVPGVPVGVGGVGVGGVGVGVGGVGVGVAAEDPPPPPDDFLAVALAGFGLFKYPLISVSTMFKASLIASANLYPLA